MLEERKVEIAAASEDSKMEEFDDDARMTVQALRLRMLKHLKEQPKMTEKEAAEKEGDGEDEWEIDVRRSWISQPEVGSLNQMVTLPVDWETLGIRYTMHVLKLQMLATQSGMLVNLQIHLGHR